MILTWVPSYAYSGERDRSFRFIVTDLHGLMLRRRIWANHKTTFAPKCWCGGAVVFKKVGGPYFGRAPETVPGCAPRLLLIS